MRILEMSALIALVGATVAPVASQVPACTGACTKTVDQFPFTVVDGCSNTLGTLAHQLVCTLGTTTCSVTGTIDWTPAITGTSGPNCNPPGPCLIWDCGGSTDSCGGTQGCLSYTSCTANVTQQHTHSGTMGPPCGAMDTYLARVRCNTSGGANTYAHRIVTFKCGDDP